MKSKNEEDVRGRTNMLGSAAAAVLLTGALLVASAMPESSKAQSQRSRAAAEAQFTSEGSERCLSCHGGERMSAVAETVHGNADNPHSPFAKQGCESCHGPGSLHVSRAAGGAGFPALTKFGDDGVVSEQSAACTACHEQDMGNLEGMAWAGSVHDADDMTCVSCHVVHTTDNPLDEPEEQLATCSGCHAEQIAAHSKFEDKGIVFDKLLCYDCHDVHQLISVE